MVEKIRENSYLQYLIDLDHYQNDNAINYFLQDISPIFGSYRGLRNTYSYLVASIPTLDYWIQRDSEYGLGQASFPYFYRMAEQLDIISGVELTGDRVLGEGLQLPTLIGYLYIDFGFAGIYFGLFILSFFSSVVYNQCKCLKRWRSANQDELL